MVERKPMRQETLPCGCFVTEYPGHTHTKMCDQHRRELFASSRSMVIVNHAQVERNNLDLVGG